MQLQSLKANTRKAGTKGETAKARRAGLTPSVLYGGEGEPVSLLVDTHDFELLMHGKLGEHAIVQLEVEDNPGLSSPALLKDVQHAPIRGGVLHADFLRIRLDQRITTSVPIHLTGQPVGVVEGGMLEHQLREVEVECLALEVPDEFVVDVSGLEVGHSVHVGELAVPEGVTIVTVPDRPVAAVFAPRVVTEEEVEGEEEEVEGEGEGEEAGPEVIGEKKQED